ncbi:MAG: hypothetical protein MK214_05200 [Thalassotalea sp.]|nr:hypothetical protein [Thalassotalea sp.]
MEEQIRIENEIKLALIELAKSIANRAKVVGDNSKLIECTSQIKLSNMEHWERFIRQEYYSALRTFETPKWNIWKKPLSLVTWVDLCSWDGYRREKALRTLSPNVPNKFLLALVIRRLNDWVPQVRLAARELLPEIILKSNPEDVVDVISFSLSHWSSWRRIEQPDRNTLLEAISSKNLSSTIANKIINSASGPATVILTQASRKPVLDHKYLDIATKSIQPAVRAKAFRFLFEAKASWLEGKKWQWTDKSYCIGRMTPIVSDRRLEEVPSFTSLLEYSSDDKSSIVRRVAAEFLIKEINLIGMKAKSVAEQFALDKSNSVRERGEYALKILDENFS